MLCSSARLPETSLPNPDVEQRSEWNCADNNPPAAYGSGKPGTMQDVIPGKHGRQRWDEDGDGYFERPFYTVTS
jgi:hypothetical protein